MVLGQRVALEQNNHNGQDGTYAHAQNPKRLSAMLR